MVAPGSNPGKQRFVDESVTRSTAWPGAADAAATLATTCLSSDITSFFRRLELCSWSLQECQHKEANTRLRCSRYEN